MRSESFKPPHPLTTSVLFLIFNRPETTEKVFHRIRQAKPPRLYIAADGPRHDRTGESERCDKVRAIATNVDWDCEVNTLFREKNLGCKLAVSSAINWFFENEEEGIILEDDCLPSLSFFRFCELYLNKYRTNPQVMQISGFNALGKVDIQNSYWFSKYGPVWGWASWRRAWQYYDVHMSEWKQWRNDKNFRQFSDSRKEHRWRIQLYKKLLDQKIDTWDYQWGFSKLIHNGLSVIPKVNLIKNIGFGPGATHTKQPLLAAHSIGQFDFKEDLFPVSVERNKSLDIMFFNEFVKPGFLKSFFRRVSRSIAIGKKDS